LKRENVTIMERVRLNQEEQKRLFVFNEVLAGRMTGQEAADWRQAQRAAFERKQLRQMKE
jgi:hypothetical protein